MLESTVTIEGQTTLPMAVRDSLAVRAGDRLRYVIVDEGVLMVPIGPASRLFSSLKYDGPPVSLQDMEDAISEGSVEL